MQNIHPARRTIQDHGSVGESEAHRVPPNTWRFTDWQVAASWGSRCSQQSPLLHPMTPTVSLTCSVGTRRAASWDTDLHFKGYRPARHSCPVALFPGDKSQVLPAFRRLQSVHTLQRNWRLNARGEHCLINGALTRGDIKRGKDLCLSSTRLSWRSVHINTNPPNWRRSTTECQRTLCAFLEFILLFFLSTN